MMDWGKNFQRKEKGGGRAQGKRDPKTATTS